MPTRWTILLEPCDEGGYTAQVAEMPEAISEGETEDEARANVLAALEDVLTWRREERLREVAPRTLVLTA